MYRKEDTGSSAHRAGHMAVLVMSVTQRKAFLNALYASIRYRYAMDVKLTFSLACVPGITDLHSMSGWVVLVTPPGMLRPFPSQLTAAPTPLLPLPQASSGCP